MAVCCLVDTSVWIDHLRAPQPDLIVLLQQGLVMVHPAIIGELACGNLPKRSQFLNDLSLQRPAVEAGNEEVLALIELHRLFGKGIGWTDAQLVASAALSQAAFLTRDKRLARIAAKVLGSRKR